MFQKVTFSVVHPVITKAKFWLYTWRLAAQRSSPRLSKNKKQFETNDRFAPFKDNLYHKKAAFKVVYANFYS